MSRSDLQLEASRANGSRSRGPVTSDGKLASARNAVKHGLLSTQVLLKTEREQTFLDFITALADEFQPATAFEESLVEAMAVARWRQQRLERETMDAQIFAEHDKNRAAMLHPAILTARAFGTLASDTRTLDLVNRYESRFDRQYLRAHRRLLEVQDRRMRNEPDKTPPPAPGPQLVPDAPKTSDSAKRTQADIEKTQHQPHRPPATHTGSRPSPTPISTHPNPHPSFSMPRNPAHDFNPPDFPALNHPPETTQARPAPIPLDSAR
jgi:hypothetical protein